MSDRALSSTLPASILKVMLIGIPLVILSESVNPGYYPKLLVLHSGLTVLAFLAFWSGVPTPASPLLLPAVTLILIHILSVTQAVNRVESVVVLSHRLSLLTAFLLAASLLHRRHITGIYQSLGIVSVLISALGIAQYAGLAGLNIASSGMPSATLGYRNFAAALTIVAIPVVLAELVRSPQTALKYLWTAALAMNSAFLLASRSRSAWGACAVSTLLCLGLVLWRSRAKQEALALPRWRQSSLLVALAAVAALGFSALVRPGMGTTGYETHSVEKMTLESTITSIFKEGSDKHRFKIWGHTVDMILAAPFLGVGIGNWQYAYPEFDRGSVTWTGSTPRRPHNDYLWIPAETGLLGFGLFLWLLVAAIRVATRAARSGRDRAAFLQVLAAVGALTAIAAHATFSFPLERISVTFAASLALAVLVLHDPHTRVLTSSPGTTRIIWITLAIAHLASASLLWRAVTFDRLAFRQTRAIERRDWEGGVSLGTQALALGIFDPQILLLRGLSHHLSGRYDLAIQDQEACLTYHPYLVNAINNLGMSLNAAGRYPDAIRTLDRIAELRPSHIEQHVNLARAYVGLGRSEEATRQLESAVGKAPERTDIALELVSHYERLGDFERAHLAISRILQDHPGNYALHYREGVIHQKQGHWEAAATSFNRVTRLNEGYAPVYYNIGELRLASGDTSGAVVAYETFLENWTGATSAAQAIRLRLDPLR